MPALAGESGTPPVAQRHAGGVNGRLGQHVLTGTAEAAGGREAGKGEALAGNMARKQGMDENG
eukprot:355739-Chlamydomonas_euryale.AAC.4